MKRSLSPAASAAGAVAADDRMVLAPMRTTRSRPAQRAHTEYTAPSSRTSARGVTVASVVASGTNGGGARRHMRCSPAKRAPIVCPAVSRVVASRASICASSVALISK